MLALRDSYSQYDFLLTLPNDIFFLFLVGIIRECLEHPGLNPEVKESVLSAVQRFKTLGAEIIEVECPRFNDGIATYYVIAPSEASANLEDNMFSFIKDLSNEGYTDIKHSLVRCKKEEPLTVW